MVVKTDTCFFTENKIFPGHGLRMARKDGKLLAFISKKSRSLYLQRKKSQKLHWTQAWRRLHKKGSVEAEAKKKVKRAGKVFKAIQGLSIDDITKKRQQKPDFRKDQRAANLREVKERNKKMKEERKRVATSASTGHKGKKSAAAPTSKGAGFVKTDTCFFTENKIFPGHGLRLARKDGKLLAFISKKSRSLYLQKKKSQKLHWTQAWRRLHKKGSVEAEAKKKVKRAGKVFKAIQGLSIDDITKKRQQKPDFRKDQRAANLREVKERNKKQKEERKRVASSAAGFVKGKKAATTASAPKGQGFVKTPKTRRVGGPAVRR